MIYDSDFYSAYLSNHFKIKSRNALYFMNLGTDELNKYLFNAKIGVNDIEFLKSIKLDLVQGFYQSVETLFGLLHSLQDPKSLQEIPNYLVKTNVNEMHAFITGFRRHDNCVSYLNELVIKNNPDLTVTKLQYLFYFISCFGPEEKSNYETDILNRSNYLGVAHILNNIALLFNQEAHNSIKHGLRCVIVDKFKFDIDIPEEIQSTQELPLIPEEALKLNSNDDVLMYYTREKGEASAVKVIIPINYKEIIYYENAIAQLLHNLLTHREYFFNSEENKSITLKHYIFHYDNLTKIKFEHSANFESIRLGQPK